MPSECLSECLPECLPERLAFDGLGQGGTAFVLHPSLSACTIDRVAVGAEHVLALSSRGQIWSWGSNRFGQLGHGTRGEPATQPSVVLGALAGRRVLDVSAGAFHSLAAVERGFHSRAAAVHSGRSQRPFTADRVRRASSRGASAATAPLGMGAKKMSSARVPCCTPPKASCSWA